MKPEDVQWAIIFSTSIWRDEPVFHRFDYMRRLGMGQYKDVTGCGRVADRRTPWLPMKHAVKFARPCRGCFAQEAP